MTAATLATLEWTTEGPSSSKNLYGNLKHRIIEANSMFRYEIEKWISSNGLKNDTFNRINSIEDINQWISSNGLKNKTLNRANSIEDINHQPQIIDEYLENCIPSLRASSPFMTNEYSILVHVDKGREVLENIKDRLEFTQCGNLYMMEVTDEEISPDHGYIQKLAKNYLENIDFLEAIKHQEQEEIEKIIINLKLETFFGFQMMNSEYLTEDIFKKIIDKLIFYTFTENEPNSSVKATARNALRIIE